MMETVVFYNRTKDEKGNPAGLVSWTITAVQFRFILESDLSWTQLFNYLNSITASEEVEEVKPE